MSQNIVAIFIEPEALVFGVDGADGGPRLERLTLTDTGLTEDGLRGWLDGQGLEPGPVVLGLDSSLCYAAELPTEGLPRLGRDEALRFRLEAKLPDDLETLSVHFIGPHRAIALAVAARDEAWRPVVDTLRSAGFALRGVVPTALMSLGNELLSGGSFLVQYHCDRVDHYSFDEEGLLSSWRVVPTHPKEIVKVLAHVESKTMAIGVEPELLPANVVTAPDESDTAEAGYHAAVSQAVLILSGGARPVLDFLNNETGAGRAQRAWLPAVAAAALVSWGLAALLFFSGVQQQSITATTQDQLREAYLELYPGQRAPRVLLPRLRSEVAGLTSAESAGAGQRDALADLVGIVLRMPADGGYEIEEVAAEAASLRLIGTVESFNTVDAIVEAISDHPAVVSSGGILAPTRQVMPSGKTRFQLTIDLANRSSAGGGRP